MTYDEIVQAIDTLTLVQRRALVHLLIDALLPVPESEKTRSVLEFAGIGAEFYDGTDAQEYVNQLRGEWDDRP